MLEEGEMGKSKDLSDFDKGQIKHLQNGRSCSQYAMVRNGKVCNGKYPPKVIQEWTAGELLTGSWVSKAH